MDKIFEPLRKELNYALGTIPLLKRSGELGLIQIYKSRIEAMPDFIDYIDQEKNEVVIVAVTLSGTIKEIPSFFEKVQQGLSKSCEYKFLLTHPDYISFREAQESKKIHELHNKIQERINDLLEKTEIPIENIKLYKAPPSCSLLITSNKMLINPHTNTTESYNTLCLLVNKRQIKDTKGKDSDIYSQYYRFHYKNAWDGPLAVRYDDYIAEQNEEVIKELKIIIEDKIKFSRDLSKFFLIGVSGPSASGKTKLCQDLIKAFKREKIDVGHITTDGWIFLNRKERFERRLSGYNPDVYKISELKKTIISIKKGNTASIPLYDHKKGLPYSSSVSYEPKQINLLEGDVALTDEILDYVDFIIFIDSSEDTQKYLRIKRDIEERGYEKDEAIQNFELHLEDYKNILKEDRSRADLILRMNRGYLITMSK